MILCFSVLILKDQLKIKKLPQINSLNDNKNDDNFTSFNNNLEEKELENNENTKIKWKIPEIPSYIYQNKTIEIKKIGFAEQSVKCEKKLIINNDIKYAKLNNVVLYQNGVIINDHIIFQHNNSCLNSNEEIQKAQQLYSHNKYNAETVKKAIYVSHNFFSTTNERMIKEHPLLALLPNKLFNKEYDLIVSDDYSQYEKKILYDYGIKSLKSIGPLGLYIEELYILDGPGCNEYSTSAISLFKTKFLQKTGYSGIEPKSIVLAYNDEKESNQLGNIKKLQNDLDNYFKDVTFYIYKKNEDYLNEIKFWQNSKVILSSEDGTNGNEIWLQQNSIFMILQTNDCFTESVQVVSDQGIEVIALFYNTKSLNGVWFNDILPAIEDVLIDNHLTMKSKAIQNNDPDDIF